MLAVNLDIAGRHIAAQPWCDHIRANQLPGRAQGGQLENVTFSADASALMLAPVQTLPTWGAAPKLRLADYNLDKSKWHEQTVRGADDWWLHSIGQVDESISPAFVFPRNCGLFWEVRAYTPSNKEHLDVLFDAAFGHFFYFEVASTGDCRLYDSRSATPGVPIKTGSISNGASLIGHDFKIAALPYRRNWLLISSDAGGHLLARVASALDTNSADADQDAPGLYVITEAGPVTMYQTAQPPSAFLTFSPLMYPAAGSLTTPSQSLLYAVGTLPTMTSDSDAEFGSSATLSTDVSAPAAGDTIQAFDFTISLTSGEGISGITGATVNGNAALALGSLHTPFLYRVELESERTLTDRVFTTGLFTKILSAHLSLSVDRGQCTFDFSLDNPPGSGIETLKDYQNVKMSAFLCRPEDVGYPADAGDPDNAIVEAAGAPLEIFAGYTSEPTYTDGTASRIAFKCEGLRKKLRSVPLANTRVDDGHKHTDVILSLLKNAGFICDDEATAQHPSEIFIYPDDETLPEADPASEPLFKPANGQSVEDYSDLICNFTGWELVDIGPKWYYAPDWYFIENNLASTGGIVDISTQSQFSAGNPFPGQIEPNAAGGLIALASEPPQQTMQSETLANDFWVIGETDDGQPIAVNYVDTASQTDKDAFNYVGERRLLIYFCPAINSVESATKVCAILVQNFSLPDLRVTWTMPDMRAEIYTRSPVNVEGYGIGLVQSLDADLSNSRARTTRYSAKLVPGGE